MTGVAGERWLIVNADDFGASAGVNQGVLEAHTDGIVTSASLMVRMPAAAAAAASSSDHRRLSIGLHVDLTGEGTPSPVDIDDVAACRIEMQAQMHLFEKMIGRPPSHLDAHHNVFRLPHLEPLFIELSDELGVPLREHSRVEYFSDFYGQWDDGLFHPEWIGAENLIRMLDNDIAPGVTELSCHPGYFDATFMSPYHREREIELRSLCHPAVRRHLDGSDLVLISYDDLDHILGGDRGSE